MYNKQHKNQLSYIKSSPKKILGLGEQGQQKTRTQQPAQIVTNVALIKRSPFTFARFKVNKVES